MADKVVRFPTRSIDLPAAPELLWREAVGEQLRAERIGLQQRIVDVAERAGVAPQYLSELERGRKDPSSEVLAAVVGALGLTVREITRRASVRLGGASVRATGQHRLDGPVCLAA